MLEAREQERVTMLREEQNAILQLLNESDEGAEEGLEAYEAAAATLEKSAQPVSDLLHLVTNHMPEGSAIAGFDYASPSQLEVTVRLFEMREAASLQDYLLQEPLFEQVTMTTLNYQEILSEEELHTEMEPVYRYEAVYELRIDEEYDGMEDRDAD